MTVRPLVFFMTHGVSLADWDRMGTFDRETYFLRELACGEREIAIVSYGENVVEERLAAQRLPGMRVIALGRLGFFASFAAAWRIRDQVPSAAILRTNQMLGAWVPGLLRALKPQSRWVLRCGYEHYRNLTLDAGASPVKRAAIFVISWFCYRFADRISVTTESIAEFVRSTFGEALRGKIRVVPNGVDVARFRPAPDAVTDASRVLAVGRLHREKNLPLLIEACVRAGLGLDLVGSGPDEEALRAEAARHKADVRFLGRVPNSELPATLARYAIFAQLSRYEGSPKTVLEAMACGLAVVGSDVPGIRDVVRNGETGLLVPLEPEAVAAALKTLAQDAGRRANLGQSARTWAERESSFERMLERERALLAELEV